MKYWEIRRSIIARGLINTPRYLQFELKQFGKMQKCLRKLQAYKLCERGREAVGPQPSRHKTISHRTRVGPTPRSSLRSFRREDARPARAPCHLPLLKNPHLTLHRNVNQTKHFTRTTLIYTERPSHDSSMQYVHRAPTRLLLPAVYEKRFARYQL